MLQRRERRSLSHGGWWQHLPREEEARYTRGLDMHRPCVSEWHQGVVLEMSELGGRQSQRRDELVEMSDDSRSRRAIPFLTSLSSSIISYQVSMLMKKYLA